MKYLIYCGPGIGDWILILPMARLIKKNDAKAHISVIMTSDKDRIKLNKLLLKLQNDIDDVDYYSMHEIGHMFKFLIHIRFHKYDYGFVLQYTDNENTSEWPCKIVNFAAKKTCGIELKSKPSVKYHYSIPRMNGYRIVDYPNLMLEKVGIDSYLNIANENLLNKELILRNFDSLNLSLNDAPLISLVVGTASVSGKVDGRYISNSAKNWQYESWAKLAELFTASGYQVALLGGNKEKEEFEAMCDGSNLNGVINLLGKCSIVQSLAVLCKSRIVIGADTGLMHCSGALKVPSLTLFGCTDPAEYLPFGTESYWISSNESCSPCFGTRQSLICKSMNCMKNIQVKDVYMKAVEIIS